MTFFRLEPISVSVPAPATASDSWLSSWWSSLWLPSISGAEREGEVKDPEKEEGHSFYRGLDKADIFIFSHEGSPALANSPFFTAATDENPTKFQDKKRVVLVLSETDDKSVEAFIDEVRNITDLEDRKKLQLIFPDSFLESEDKKNKLYQKIFTLDFPVKFDFMSDYIDPSSTIKYDFLPNLDQKIGRDVLREDGDYLEYFLRKIEYIESSAVIEGKKEGLKETLVGEIKESGSDVKYSFLLSGGNLKSQEGRDDKYWKDVINRLDVENNISSRRSEIKRISNNALKEATLGEGDKPLLNFMQNRTQGYGLQMSVKADTSKEGILSFTINEVHNGAGKYAGFKEGDKIEFKIANSKSLHSQAIIISQLRSGNLTGAKIYKKNQENQLEPINHRDQRLIQEKIFFAYDEKIAQPLITENLSHEQYESCTESLSKIINLQQTLSVAIHHLADAKKRGGTELQAGLQADIDRLEADLKEQRGVAASLGAEKEEAEEKMQKLTAELEEAKKGLKDLKVIRGKLMKTREDIEGVTQKVQDATKLLREEQAKSEEAKRQVSELQVELTAAEKDRNDAAEQLNKLIGEFATVSEQMSIALSIASGSRSKEVTKDTSLAASKERFQQSIEKINKVSKEYAESKDELTCDIEKKNEEIAQLQNKLTRDTEEKNQKIAQLKDKLTRDTEEKNQKIAQLKDELTRDTEEKNQEIAKLKEERKDLLNRLLDNEEKHRTEKKGLVDKMQAAFKEYQLKSNEHLEKNRSLQGENDQLKLELDQVKKELEGLAEVNAQQKSLLQHELSAKSEIEKALKSVQDQARDALRKHGERERDLVRQVEEAQKQVATKVEEAQGREEEREKEAKTLQEAMDKALEEMNKQKETNTELTKALLSNLLPDFGAESEYGGGNKFQDLRDEIQKILGDVVDVSGDKESIIDQITDDKKLSNFYNIIKKSHDIAAGIYIDMEGLENIEFQGFDTKSIYSMIGEYDPMRKIITGPKSDSDSKTVIRYLFAERAGPYILCAKLHEKSDSFNEIEREVQRLTLESDGLQCDVKKLQTSLDERSNILANISLSDICSGISMAKYSAAVNGVDDVRKGSLERQMKFFAKILILKIANTEGMEDGDNKDRVVRNIVNKIESSAQGIHKISVKALGELKSKSWEELDNFFELESKAAPSPKPKGATAAQPKGAATTAQSSKGPAARR